MTAIRRRIAVCALALTMLLPSGCSLFGGRPGRTTQPKTLPPSLSPTQRISSVAPGKTASQDTAGAVTKLPEAATAANATTIP